MGKVTSGEVLETLCANAGTSSTKVADLISHNKVPAQRALTLINWSENGCMAPNYYTIVAFRTRTRIDSKQMLLGRPDPVLQEYWLEVATVPGRLSEHKGAALPGLCGSPCLGLFKTTVVEENMIKPNRPGHVAWDGFRRPCLMPSCVKGETYA